jgi:Kdo2-lipid IVA lauroyltransferase/acyltransferase
MQPPAPQTATNAEAESVFRRPWWVCLLAAFPLGACQRIGAAIGWIVYLASAGYRKKFNAQWDQATQWVKDNHQPAWPQSAKRKAIAHGGQMAMEALWVWCRPNTELMKKMTCVNPELFSEVESRGSALILLTPHLSCFEAVARYYASRQPITALFKPSKFELVNELTSFGRNVPNLTMAPADVSGVRKLLKALRAKQTIGLLPDQVPPAGQGVWADFFSRQAYCIDLPEKLAKLGKAEVIMIVCERLTLGQGWRLHLELMDVQALAPAQVNQVMQRWIAQFPEQYLWGYNRFKEPVSA